MHPLEALKVQTIQSLENIYTVGVIFYDVCNIVLQNLSLILPLTGAEIVKGTLKARYFLN
jgi:hypothetical protein